MNKSTIQIDIEKYLKEIREKNLLVVVEGKKDEWALRHAGITRILTFNTYYKTVEKIDNEVEIVLLVDLDREGRKIYRRLKDELTRRGVRINDRLRNFLFKNTKIRQIESLISHMHF